MQEMEKKRMSLELKKQQLRSQVEQKSKLKAIKKEEKQR
jgi:hypothetical protein